MTLRLAALSGRLNWSSRGRLALLAVLVAVAMIVFLIVSELSRASSIGLDDAIAADVGTGLHRIEVLDLGMTRDQLTAEVARAVAPFTDAPIQVVDVLPAIQPECPPYENLGSVSLLAIRDADGNPVDLTFGTDIPFDTKICFDGMVIPSTAIYLPNQAEQHAWGTGVIIDVAYQHLGMLATTGPVEHHFLVATGDNQDHITDLSEAVQRQLADAAARYGIPLHDVVSVVRGNQGENIRAVSQGIKLVYGIIGWGVLVLGGLGLLVAELIVVRDRSWFFGLARAVGARNRHIAGLVIADIVAILTVGTILAVLLAIVMQPTANEFASNAFQVDVQLLRPEAVPQLVLAEAVILLVAAAYPARRAVKQDPLDVLEPAQ